MTLSDTMFKAIAHPVRRDIIAMLAASNRSVKEITARFEISQPAISQHLRELKEARLVDSKKVGMERQYRLTGGPLKVVYEWSSQYRRFFDPAGHVWEFRDAGPGAKRGSEDGY